MTSSACNLDVLHDVREALFGGQGKVRVWQLGPPTLRPFAAVLACELEPGASVGAHVQQQCAEILVGLSGNGTVSVNGQRRAFGAGSLAELALGETLEIANSSASEPFRYLIIKAQA